MDALKSFYDDIDAKLVPRELAAGIYADRDPRFYTEA